MARLATDYLDETAARFPDKVAFVDGHRSIRFHELQQEAYRVASDIVNKGWFKAPIVAYFDKNVECVIAMMGIAYSGNIIVPLDTRMPPNRIEKIMGLLQPKAILTDLAHQEMARGFCHGAELLAMESIREHPADAEAARSQLSCVIDTDAIYIFFTSGSTGIPKGVVICHHSVINNVEWISNYFHIDNTNVIGNGTQLFFAMSSTDLFTTMKTGCTLCLMEPELFIFPAQTMHFLVEKQIDFIFWVPTVLVNIANSGILEELDVLPPLRHVLFCGGAMPNKQLSAWRKAFPLATFGNLYALTELTAICAYYVVDREFSDEEPLPMGRPCGNRDLFVLNENDQLVQEGEVGELCVRGSCLGLGYFRNPERTAAMFVQNPLQSFYPERILRTGDLVRYNERGELMYVSRKDFQIKHMGHRIELGEIETAVSAVEGIASNCCVYDQEKGELVLFYTGEAGPVHILRSAKQLLPHYMIPARLVQLETMPLNLNSKIDRIALQKHLHEP